MRSYIPLEIARAALGTDGSTLDVEIPSEYINGVHLRPGEEFIVEKTVRLIYRGAPIND